MSTRGAPHLYFSRDNEKYTYLTSRLRIISGLQTRRGEFTICSVSVIDRLPNLKLVSLVEYREFRLFHRESLIYCKTQARQADEKYSVSKIEIVLKFCIKLSLYFSSGFCESSGSLGGQL